MLLFCAFIGMLPVSCGAGHPAAYQYDVTLSWGSTLDRPGANRVHRSAADG